MKKLNLFKALCAIIMTLVIYSSCKKDDDFIQVTAFEKSIHDAINEHRVSVGKPEMILSFIMMDDAKSYSTKMANNSVEFGTEGLAADLQTLKSNLAATSAGAWVATCQYENADSVMKIVLNNAEVKTTIESTFNQSAVGAVKSSDGIYFITHLLLYIPPKN